MAVDTSSLLNVLLTILVSIILFQFYKRKAVINGMKNYPDHIVNPSWHVENGEVMTEEELTKDLREAIKNVNLTLFYQPILNSKEEIIAMEALLRWNHPKYGFISPEKIIHIAEKNDLISMVGEWVLSTACRQVVKWQLEYQNPLNISVNVSPSQFLEKGFVSKVEKVLADTGLNPTCLELEITESVSMHDFEEMCLTLNKLKALGVSISVDDFGTGYSSLEYIDRLPIDRIKIDKSFIMNITPVDEKTHIIANTVISLAKKLNMEVVAEGVESLYQYKLLSDHACHRFQGYYFYKPLDPKACNQIFAKHIISQS